MAVITSALNPKARSWAPTGSRILTLSLLPSLFFAICSISGDGSARINVVSLNLSKAFSINPWLWKCCFYEIDCLRMKALILWDCLSHVFIVLRGQMRCYIIGFFHAFFPFTALCLQSMGEPFFFHRFYRFPYRTEVIILSTPPVLSITTSAPPVMVRRVPRSEEHTSELQSRPHL